MKHLVLLVFLISACSRIEDPPAPPQTPPQWTVTERGAGPLRVGMTFPEAKEALGSDLVESDSTEPCYFFRPRSGMDDILVMVVNGRIVRLDVVGESIPTDTGARVGDSESRIEMLYSDRVEISPHKYTDGHYLTVRPVEPEYRLIFETDGEKVTRYRAGTLPEVEWVEGCS